MAMSGSSTGQKKWIGNATFARPPVIIWARDVNDNQVKGFVVEHRGHPGSPTTKMRDKIALRVVQNACITLDGRARARG